MDRKIVSKILGISEKSYYRWKEERKIFKLLEKYFSDYDLKEFLEEGKISKLDNLEKLNEYKQKKSLKILNFFTNNLNSQYLYKNDYNSILSLDINIIEILMQTFINYDKNDSFFNQLNKAIFNIEDLDIKNEANFILNMMIKENIINIIDELAYEFVNSDFMKLIEYNFLDYENETINFYICFNIFKYKSNLILEKKEELINTLIKEYKNNKKENYNQINNINFLTNKIKEIKI